MMARDLKTIRGAANILSRLPFSYWGYGDSVGFEGLHAASRLLDDNSYAAIARGMARGAFGRDPSLRESDNTIPGRALALLAAEAGDDVLLAALCGVAASLAERRQIRGLPIAMNRAALVLPSDGGSLSAAEVALLANPKAAIYVDCLHFDPPFLCTLGRILGNDELLREGLRQAAAYACVLQDEQSGLFHHFYLEQTDERYIRGWSRGQGWALLGLLDCLAEAPADHELSAALRLATRRLAQAMICTQRPDGEWPAVADRPESGHESSTAAFMAYGLRRGVQLGILDDECDAAAVEAWQATCRNVDDEGRLLGVSAAVWSSTRIEHYFHVSRGHITPWGQGPLLLAAELHANRATPT
jgi:Predicted unsaturated glucuronyl hydrolase involved in regulation of bacterial surface properties, and related proteins